MSIADETTAELNDTSSNTASRAARWFSIFTVVLFFGAILAQSAQVRGNWALHVAGTERDQILSTLPAPNGGRGERVPRKEGQWELRKPEICFMCRQSPPPDRGARDGEASFVYIDRGEGLDEELALVQQRLIDLGYEPRCSGSDFRGDWFFYDRGPDSHVVRVTHRIVENATSDSFVAVAVLTTVYGAKPIGLPEYVSAFPGSCL